MTNEKLPPNSGALEPRPADHADVAVALTERTQQILDQLPVRRVELSQPIDERGARVRVSVEPGQARVLPEAVVVELPTGPVTIALEASEDYRVLGSLERDTLPTRIG